MATAFFRTVILYLLLIAGLRITGKRQIGELEPIELVLTMLLSDLASVPMQDFGIPLVNGIVPIVTLLSLSMLLSYGSLRSVRFRTLLCGEPTLIIRSGHILQDAMRRNRLTVDELLEALRGQGISDLQEVKYAVLETSGQLSVLPRADCQPVTPRQLSLQPEDPQTLPTVVISDGRLLRRSMERLGLDDGWLQARLRDAGVRSPREVFLLSVDELLEALRGQGISDLQEVKYAVLETSGQLSVLPRADCQPVTPRQLSLQPEDPQTLPTVVISDGRLLRRSMERLGLDDGWLQARLRDAGVRSPREVFLLSVDEAGSVVCLPKEGKA